MNANERPEIDKPKAAPKATINANEDSLQLLHDILNINEKFLNVRCDEVATIIRMTDKVCFLSCKSDYGTFEIKKSISNILNLIKTGQWENTTTK